MKSYRTLALKELLSQKVTSILILIAVVLSTMMTTIVGQSIGRLDIFRDAGTRNNDVALLLRDRIGLHALQDAAAHRTDIYQYIFRKAYTLRHQISENPCCRPLK